MAQWERSVFAFVKPVSGSITEWFRFRFCEPHSKNHSKVITLLSPLRLKCKNRSHLHPKLLRFGIGEAPPGTTLKVLLGELCQVGIPSLSRPLMKLCKI